jgi:hypothetical protein
VKLLDLVEQADKAQMAELAKEVLRQYLGVGFQTLQKRDLDLLFFYRMERHGLLGPTSSNYDVAQLLNVTPQKVASLRRDAYARWADQSEVRRLVCTDLRRLLQGDPLRAAMGYGGKHEREAGWFPLVLEHPAVRSEIEAKAKRDGGIVRYERNREVIQIGYGELLSSLFFFEAAEPTPAVITQLNKHFKTHVKKTLASHGIQKQADLDRNQLSDVAVKTLELAAAAATGNPIPTLMAAAETFKAIVSMTKDPS